MRFFDIFSICMYIVCNKVFRLFLRFVGILLKYVFYFYYYLKKKLLYCDWRIDYDILFNIFDLLIER